MKNSENSLIQFCVYPHPHPQTGVEMQRSLSLLDLQDLFQRAAFWAQNRSLEDLQVALDNSKPICVAWEGDRLVGFARATSDGVYRATIWDVVIHPDYQGNGLGRKLVVSLLSHPHLSRVERIYLMTTYQEKFYERIGFERNSSTTMVLHNQPLDLLKEIPHHQSVLEDRSVRSYEEASSRVG